MSYAVYQYFLNRGSHGVIVRVHDEAKVATYEIDGSDLKLQDDLVHHRQFEREEKKKKK